MHDELTPTFTTPTDREAQLAALIDGLLVDARAGQPASIGAVAAAHPELADDLRELWDVAVLADAFGSQQLESNGDSERAPTALAAATATRPPRLGVGQLQFTDYEILEELGRGGMGVVYRARQRSLNRIVALKIVLRGATATQADLARFRGEAETAARLNHPNIVPVYEVGQHDGLPYFTMKYVPGTTLAQRLADGPLTGREAARLLAPVARAIAAAHQQGVLHRDLKPSNILIDDAGCPYVSDFGLAKRVLPENPPPSKGGARGGINERDSASGSAASPTSKYPSPNLSPQGRGAMDLRLTQLTQTGAILGTPGYMSPEQAAGSRGVIGTSADVYSLGAILYATLTGRAPFQAASPLDTVMMVLEQDPVSPQLLNPRVDRDLEMVALKCLQKPCELRYADANALADDLDAYLANEPISARSSQFRQIVTRAFRETHHAQILENWGLLWILHAVVLLLLCLVTNAFQLSGVTSRLPYIGLWTLGLGSWALVFWTLRRRSGPITFIERQIAHVWAGSMMIDTLMYAIEWQLELPVLTLSPMLGPVSAAVFLIKAAMLSGVFYIYAAALCLTGLVMAWLQHQSHMQNLGLTVFGVVSFFCFFLPGWKYYRQLKRSR